MKNRIDYKELSNDELKAKLVELKAALFNLRFSHKAGQLTSPMELSKTRKEIARALTEINVRGLDINGLEVLKAKKDKKKEKKTEVKEIKKEEAKKEVKEKASVKKTAAETKKETAVKTETKKTAVKKEGK